MGRRGSWQPDQGALLPRATATACALLGRPVMVVAGHPAASPGASGRTIVLGEAAQWHPAERFAVLVHEVAHLRFPVTYPGGARRILANAVDDIRIERQWLEERPYDADLLALLAVRKIAGLTEVKLPEATVPSDPFRWVLLAFRRHIPADVRQVATVAMLAAAGDRARDPRWHVGLRALVTQTWAVSRLKIATTNQLRSWTDAFLDVFAEYRPSYYNRSDSSLRLKSEILDSSIRQVMGKGNDADAPWQAILVESEPDPLSGLPERLPKSIVARKRLRIALASHQGELLQRVRSPDAPDFEFDGASTAPQEVQLSEFDLDLPVSAGIGRGNTTPGAPSLIPSQPDPEVMRQVSRVLQQAPQPDSLGPARSGRLQVSALMRSVRTDILPHEPFQRPFLPQGDAQGLLLVAIDSSTSSEALSSTFRSVAHALLLVARRAGWKAGAIAWAGSSVPLVSLSDPVEPDRWPSVGHSGDTNLLAAVRGCLDLAAHHRIQRRAAVILTDGAICPDQIPRAANLLAKGFLPTLLLAEDAIEGLEAVHQAPKDPRQPSHPMLEVQAVSSATSRSWERPRLRARILADWLASKLHHPHAIALPSRSPKS